MSRLLENIKLNKCNTFNKISDVLYNGQQIAELRAQRTWNCVVQSSGTTNRQKVCNNEQYLRKTKTEFSCEMRL